MKLKIFITLALFFILINGVWAGQLSTLLELRAECRNQSVLITHPFYPDSVWNSWINQACMDLASYLVVEKLDTIHLIAGTMVYDCESNFIGIIGLFPLKPEGKGAYYLIPVKDVLKYKSASLSTNFWQSGKGEDAKIGFFSVPTSPDTLLMVYGAEAENLSSDTDSISIPYTYRTLIIDYVVYRALLREGKRIWRDYFENYKNNLILKLQADQKVFDIQILPQKIQK